MNIFRVEATVKPVYNDLPRDPVMAVVDIVGCSFVALKLNKLKSGPQSGCRSRQVVVF